MDNGKINRRRLLHAAGISAAGFALGGLAKSVRAASERPARQLNFLWISCEDISPDLACYGDGYAASPNLDRLAVEGCRYTRAFVSFPVCAPTRSSIITGVHPGTLGSMHMRTKNKSYEAVPPAGIKCFTEYLRAAGYYCTNNSKTDYQFTPPFTAWDESAKGAHWRNRPADMPFFSVFNLTTTHESRCWPRDSEVLMHDPTKAPVPPYYPDTPIVRENIARYYDNITEMDKQAGDLLEQLEQDGLARDTVVFFWSDHGRGLPRCKRWPYDSGLHVPLIIRWPGRIEAGSVCDDLVNLIDLAPTLLSLAGIDVPEYMQGRALLGQKKSKPREYVFGGRNRMDASSNDYIRTARDKRYRYIRNFNPEAPYAQRIDYMEKMPIMQEWRRLNAEGKLTGPQKIFFEHPKPPEELYDLTADPYEVNNMADSPDHQKVLRRMRIALEKWIKEAHDLGGLDEDELIERMWPGRKQPVTATPTFDTSPNADGNMRVAIRCATEGASIGYRVAEQPRWLIYTRPITIAHGVLLEAKAIRIGYKESETAQLERP
ncbi:MAG TPA: sulfatase-like hydrolase/transferase [Sedimentisphaerales bacterium]|nr:sulfatase-like hydrolase/transferase [Sedimentisphaerales bacterium]